MEDIEMIKETFRSKNDLKKRLSQIRKAKGNGSVWTKNIKYTDRIGQVSKTNSYEINGVVRGEYSDFGNDKILGYIKYPDYLAESIPPREEAPVKNDKTETTVKSKNVATQGKSKELFTSEEVEAIKAINNDDLLLGKNKSDTARRIVIKYHNVKTDTEMLEIAKRIWTTSNVQNDLIKYHHKELIEKGVISA